MGSISAAEDKLASLPSEIRAAVAKLTQLKSDVKQHHADKQAAKDAMAGATAIREKEAAAFAKEKTYYDSTITAIKSGGCFGKRSRGRVFANKISKDIEGICQGFRHGRDKSTNLDLIPYRW